MFVYVGRGLLTGKDYYDFNVDVPQQTWDRVKMLFENFGEGGGDGGLEGWLTSSPGLVEEYLRIRNPIERGKVKLKRGKRMQLQQMRNLSKPFLNHFLCCAGSVFKLVINFFKF